MAREEEAEHQQQLEAEGQHAAARIRQEDGSGHEKSSDGP